MNENEIGTIIVDTAVYLHKKLGPGLLENVYEVILANVKLGYILNFSADLMKDGIVRTINGVLD